MSIYLILFLLGICSFILSCGVTSCKKRWGPWLILSGIVFLFALIILIIYSLI
ncbi:hypothetical protein PT286_01415 [Neisseriaceae bacterium ESL0693]|nr:hypothetical protein [Neisseriaceae bacterium ESL0693]